MSSSSFPHPSYNYHDNVSSYSYSLLNTKILVAAVTILIFVIIFILALHVYARFFWSPRELAERRRSRQHRRPELLPIVREATLLTAINGEVGGGGGGGLEKAIVEALPMFEYRSAISGEEVEVDKEEGEVLECAVCLSEFKDMEMGRVLPRCHHQFHTDCIGMWLFSHSTCPLCRASAHPCSPAIEIVTTLSTSDLPSPSPVTPQEEEEK